MADSKTCNKCLKSKELAAFSRNAKAKDQLGKSCRECVAARMKNYYQRRKELDWEQLQEQSRAYRQANKERLASTKAAYIAKNRSKVQARKKRWYEANKERIAQALASKVLSSEQKRRRKESSTAWRKANPAKVLARAAWRRAEKAKRTPAWADKDAIAAMYETAARVRREGTNVHIDHIIPLFGKNVCGLHVENNLHFKLASFNMAKSNRLTTVEEDIQADEALILALCTPSIACVESVD